MQQAALMQQESLKWRSRGALHAIGDGHATGQALFTAVASGRGQVVAESISPEPVASAATPSTGHFPHTEIPHTEIAAVGLTARGGVAADRSGSSGERDHVVRRILRDGQRDRARRRARLRPAWLARPGRSTTPARLGRHNPQQPPRTGR